MVKSTRKTDYFPFEGGLNLETPALSLKGGELIGCRNYEPAIEGGYRRVDGYERFSSFTLPSKGVYHTVDFENGEHEPQINEVLTGVSSKSTGRLLAIVVESGAWGTSDAAGYMVLHVLSGSFISGETLTIHHPEAFSSGFSSGFGETYTPVAFSSGFGCGMR